MKTGLVLGGGSARGAYEAGVLSYLRTELASELGDHVKLDVIAGTSVGALNACYLAATSDRPEIQSHGMVQTWTSLKIEEILQFGVTDVFRILREFLGTTPIRWEGGLTGGLVNPAGLIEVVANHIPWRNLLPCIRSGAIDSLAVSATHVATGRTLIFLQRREGTAPPWSRDVHTEARHVRIGPKHALASAALPVLFPSVRIGGQLFVDGGLRHSVPLSPALRLGAERVIVVPLRHKEDAEQRNAMSAKAQEKVIASAPFLLGKTMNALLLDYTDQDLDRMERLNAMIEAGTEAYGPSFVDTLNRALVPHRNQPVRYVRHMVVRPSQDIGRMAADYIRSAEFKRRVKNRLVGRVLRRLGEREADDEADLVSYLLFDGGFADQLIQLGRADARAQREAWVKFFSEPERASEKRPILEPVA
jgi:NTE family protein